MKSRLRILAVIALLAIIPAAHLKADTLEIVKATWKVQNKADADITAKLNSFVKDGRIDVQLSSGLVGQPKVGKGVGCNVDISYRVNGGKIETITVGGNARLTLGAAPKTIVPPANSTSDSVLIEVSVPASRPSATTQPSPDSAPSDPDAIERPEYRNKPKAMVKNITSVTAMVVRTANDGESTGFTADIIATVPAQSRETDKAGAGFFRVDGDQDMKTSFEEAIRAVTLRYPLWEPGHIDFSFGEKSILHGGPSAGTAFALLMLSTLEGFNLDPKCAVTGDISVDWKVRKVGGVVAKLRGAVLDNCLYAAIPESNESAVPDMALLSGHSSLWNIQLFSIATLQEAQAVVRQDRAPQLAQAIKLFAELQPQLTKYEKQTLQDPSTVTTLNHILQLAPNHLSAKYTLTLANGTAPKLLSSAATLHSIGVILYPYQGLILCIDNVKDLPASLSATTAKRIAALQPIASKDLQPLVADLVTFNKTIDAIAAQYLPATALKSSIDAMKVHLSTLSSDPEFVGNVVRDGY